jgi:hypothetical protein
MKRKQWQTDPTCKPQNVQQQPRQQRQQRRHGVHNQNGSLVLENCCNLRRGSKKIRHDDEDEEENDETRATMPPGARACD